MTDSNAVDGSDAAVAELVDQFTNRLHAGESPDPEAFAAAHPAQAERLRQLLPALHVLADLSGTDHVGHVSNVPEALGDYRILREVGRGGMGVVYEAQQLSLNRRVALKVLPFAATMDPRQLQRFHNEALAAAHLEHPHIVPVYGVGCERSVHFYAMRFVEGHTLAQVIDQLRTLRGQEGASLPDAVAAVSTQAEARSPNSDEQTNAYTPGWPAPPAAAAETAVGVRTRASGSARFSRSYFRSVAELGAQLAEALDHAHQMGVVHRDIKPSNLMLDARGKVWITDFGLARLDSAASMTMTGDLVGTLRYMSPEQALAKRVTIDHRSDVYSLGVTLYELLTLESPFDGKDRQEILRQIAFEEPRPPRRLCRTIPHELETIVLKAIEKNPQDRYATAQELADDLHSFLNDQPIRARRPSVVQRLRRWGRRHQAVVVTAAAGLLVTLAVAAGGIGWIVRDRDARQTEAEGPVKAAVDEAELLLEHKKLDEALSAALRAEGLLVHAGGHPQLEPQVQALLKDVRMLVTIEEIRLNMSNVKDGHFDFAGADKAYEKAFRDYGIDVETLAIDVATARISERRIKTELAAALDSWAARSASGNESGRKLFAVARAADPDEGRGRLRDLLEGGGERALAELIKVEKADSLPVSSLSLLTVVVRKKGNLARIVPLLRRAQQRQPDDFWANHSLASALHQMEAPQLDEAIGYFRVAVALRPESPGARLSLGNALRDKGQLDEAIAEYQEAIRLKKEFAGAHNNLGVALEKKGQLDDAIKAHHEAIRLKPDFTEAHHNLGNALNKKGQLDEAIAEFREAIRLKKDLAEAHCDLGNVLKKKLLLDDAIAEYLEAIRLKKDDAITHNGLGGALWQKGEHDEAIAEYREAIRLNKDYSDAHTNLGCALADKRQIDGAIKAFREAIRLKPNAVEAHNDLGQALWEKGQLDEAIAEYREAIRLKPDLAQTHLNLGCALSKKGQHDEAIGEFREAISLKKDYAQAHYNLGVALAHKGQLDEAIAEYREAICLRPEYPEAHCNLGDTLKRQGQFVEALACLRRGHELGSRNPRWPFPSAQWVKVCERLADSKLTDILSGKERPKDPAEQAEYANVCRLKRLDASAARLYQHAFASQPSLADDPRTGNRYDAACAAALAGCGQGEEAAKLDLTERARWRRQALDWLRADLALWTKQLEGDDLQQRDKVRQTLQHWQRDPDLEGVRGEAGLAQLPEAERADWRRFWAEVKAAAEATPQQQKPPKQEPGPGQAGKNDPSRGKD